MAKVDAETARKLFAQNCSFVLAASDISHFPVSKLLDVAFIGRSNVGKSSLINAVTGRKNLARASNTPGRTQEVVFFDLGQRLMLVDLPGYGHAEAPRSEQERWTDLVHQYLKKRPNLRLVCLLIDSRHGALANDLTMMKFLDRAAVSYQIVLTKSDQIHATEREAKIGHIKAHLTKHPAARLDIMLTSSEKGTGIEELRMLLAEYAA